MASFHLDVDWDNLSVGSNESFFQRAPASHEPMRKQLLKKESARVDPGTAEASSSASSARVEQWTQAAAKETERHHREATRKPPVASVRPRGRSVPSKKLPNTIPVTPNVLKKRTMPRSLRVYKPEPTAFVFKARPAPSIHHQGQSKSSGNLKDSVRAATKDLKKLSVVEAGPATRSRGTDNDKENQKALPMTMNRSSRADTRSNAREPRLRSNSAPGRATAAHATIPVTPMVLKRNASRPRTISAQSAGDAIKEQQKPPHQFKAKAAEVLHRKPFKPKLPVNGEDIRKPFELRLDERIRDRKVFNNRATDAWERKQKEAEDKKKRLADEQYAAARKLTNFRATRNPFK